jgi:hypothetical protein
MKGYTDRVYLVVDKVLKEMLEEKYSVEIIEEIKNNGSHFSKKPNYEYLVKIN